MDIQSLVPLFLSSASLGGVFWLGWRLGQIQLKVDTTWGYIMKRAFGDANAGGQMTHNSPFKASRALLESFDHEFKKTLTEWYYQHGQGLSDLELFYKLHQAFGDVFFEKICLPNRFPYGVCVLGAMFICRHDQVTAETRSNG